MVRRWQVMVDLNVASAAGAAQSSKYSSISSKVLRTSFATCRLRSANINCQSISWREWSAMKGTNAIEEWNNRGVEAVSASKRQLKWANWNEPNFGFNNPITDGPITNKKTDQHQFPATSPSKRTFSRWGSAPLSGSAAQISAMILSG